MATDPGHGTDPLMQVMVAEIRGDIKLVLEKVDNTNKRVDEAHNRLDKHDHILEALKAAMWKHTGIAGLFTALLSSGVVVVVYNIISAK